MNPSLDDPVQSALDALMALCAHYMPPSDLDMVREAFAVAHRSHAGAERKSGEPYILHPLAVATITAELAMDAYGVSAALLHDTVEDTDLTGEAIEAQFGAAVRTIVEGVTKVSQVESKDDASPSDSQPHALSLEARAERKKLERLATLRKLLLAMRDDPRVALVKIADRLHNLRTLDSMKGNQRERTSRETLEVYAPLAGRIGLYIIKNEMEDLAFSYLEPEAFAQISARLEVEIDKRREWAASVCRRLQHELCQSGIIATVNWRSKRPYRTQQEANELGADLALLNDLIAFRVLLPTTGDCYRALAVIHAHWRPIRYDDYIAAPKINGYQSFHTFVFALEGDAAKLHIRTHEMHRHVQHGIASYWLERAARGQYVDGGSPREMRKMREMVSWVTQIANLDEDVGEDPVELLNIVKGDILRDQIVVYTPKGDSIELPEYATVLDAAYKIHTDIGDHTVGAVIQTYDLAGNARQRTVGPDYQLRRGDVIRVQTSPTAHPDPAWLSIARSNYAKAKITRAIRLRQRQREVAARDTNDLDYLLSIEGIAVRPLAHPSGKVARTELGRCCCPCPGDALLGLAQRGNLVTLHRDCCRFLKAAVERRRAEGLPYTDPMPINWAEINVKSYAAPLLISGQDHPGLMHELTVCASQLGLNVSSSNASANTARYRAAIALTLDIPSNIRLDYITGRLRRVPGIVSVWRDTGKGCFENRS